MNLKKDTQGYQLYNISQIFDYGNRAFRIPDYQRGYSWEAEQREDLLKDLEYLLDGDYNHYTGTIVATTTKSTRYYGKDECFDIVDGQQRFTTVVLLLSVLYNSYEKGDKKTESVEQIPQIFFFSGMDTGNTSRKFFLQEEQDPLFFELLQGKAANHVAKTKSEQNLLDAVAEFKVWVGKNKERREEYAEVITKRLGFLFYTPENSSEIGIMFEVINNRGKSLSELEKVKNYLIYFADKNGVSDLKAKVNVKWGTILSNLNAVGYHSNDSENSFLRNCWIVFKDTNKSKSFYVYENLKLSFSVKNRSHWKQLVAFVDFIEEASATYRKFLSRGGVVDPEERKQLERIALQPSNASVIPLILAVYSKITDTRLRVDALELIEKLNFRYYGVGVASRSDSGQGSLFHIAHLLYHHGDASEKTANDLRGQLLNFINQRAPDKVLVEYLTLDKDERYDYYNWRGGLKFFLASYEEYLRGKKKESVDLVRMLAPRNKLTPNDFFHLEHIWAKKEQSVIKDEERDILDVNKRRLANFALLKEVLNIKASNDRIEIKIKDWYKSNGENTPNTWMILEIKNDFDEAWQEINAYRSKRTWRYWYDLYQKFLDKRETKLIKFALERWKVDGLPAHNRIKDVTINSFTDNDEVYSLTMLAPPPKQQ